MSVIVPLVYNFGSQKQIVRLLEHQGLTAEPESLYVLDRQHRGWKEHCNCCFNRIVELCRVREFESVPILQLVWHRNRICLVDADQEWFWLTERGAEAILFHKTRVNSTLVTLEGCWKSLVWISKSQVQRASSKWKTAKFQGITKFQEAQDHGNQVSESTPMCQINRDQ